MVLSENAYLSCTDKCIPRWKKVMTSFLSDWWPATSSAESEATVISGRYEMGDPLGPSEVEGNREGEACPPVPLPSGVRNALK
jgi:hypothetical protein